MDGGRKLGRLMKVISSAYDATKNELLEQYGLTSRQVDLLGFLRECDGHEATQKEITQYLHVSYATSSGIIRRLVEKGFVERTTCKQDKRSNSIRLADEALGTVDESVRQFKNMDELVMAGFSKQDKEQLMSLLERLLANAEAIKGSRTN
ncbi:MAG: MarR family transcriptional regulator [Coriobacteriales bacterium]|nr:MarR family transcriptional regulator [Coriobacteriales bacterium]